MEVNLLNLEGLTNEERTIILNVIRRDDEVCRRLETRIKQLKAELHDIRMKSALRTGDDLSKMCARCHMIFGIFVNTGDICPGCHFRVCKNCRENLISHGWMCILCFRENQIRWLTGEWMGKDKTGKSKQIRATDLVRASLRIRHENRRFSSDYTDYAESEKKKTGTQDETTFTIPNKTGSLGGLEDRTGHGSSSSDSSGRHTARVEYPQESDKRRLSTLLESLRSGFGAGTQDGVASATVGNTAGGEMVVQHVSCRRRRDSNSSSDSEPSCQTRETSGARKSRSSGSETLAAGRKASARHGQGDPESALTTRVSSANRLAPESPDCEVMSSRREGQARRSADPVLDGGRRHAQSETWAGVEDGRDKREVRRRMLPQPHLAAAAAVAAADTRPKSGGARSPSHLHDRPEERLLLPAPVTPSGDDDHSSGCSFTSSEWGEVTPTSPSADTPSRRPGHSGPEGLVERRDQSSVDHSSGYLSFPKRSGENSHFANEHFTKASHNPPRSSSAEITFSEARPQAGEGRLEVPVMQVHVHAAPNDPPGTQVSRSPAEQHVRRHSSGRSDASLASARTASPATKLRLLDLASQRALDRDGDSMASWSGGSEDTLSLGMSCTGLRASPEAAQSLAAPTGRRPAPKPPGPSQGSAAGDEKSSLEEHSLPADGDNSTSINSENGRREEIGPVTKFVPSGAANAVPSDSVHNAGVVLCPSDVHAHSFSLPQFNQHGAVTVPFNQESMQAKGDQKQKIGDGSSCGEQKDMFTMDATSLTLLSGLERKSLKECDTKSQDKNDEICLENTSPVLHKGGKDGKSCVIDTCSQAGNTREVNKESVGLVEDLVEHISHHHGAGEEQFEGRVISLVPEAGGHLESPLAALRAPKNELPYTLQLFLRCNSSTSDTLSIISELSEPSESCHEGYLGDEREKNLLDNDDEGSDDTVCNDPHVFWSDKHATHAGFNVEKSEDKETLRLDEEDVVVNRKASLGHTAVLSIKDEVLSIGEEEKEHDLSIGGAKSGRHSHGGSDQLPQKSLMTSCPVQNEAAEGLVVLSESASGNGSGVEVANEVELHASAVCHVYPPLEAFSQKVYFAGKGVQDVAEGTRAEDVEAKVEETSSSNSQTKPVHDGGHRSEIKHQSLSSEKDEKYSSQVVGDALVINADETQEEKNQDPRRDFKGSLCAVAAIVDKENAFDDEENLGSTSSSGNVQENTFQEEIKRNVIINTAYERNVIIDTTYEKKVSDKVDMQPIETELVLDSGLGQEANLIVECIEEKSNADEGTEVPFTVTQICSDIQREIKPLVTGTDGTPSTPEQSGAGYCGQNVTAAAGRVTDTTVPPKPVDLGQKVTPAAGSLPVIIAPIAASDSDKDIATGTGRLPFASPQLRLPGDFDQETFLFANTLSPCTDMYSEQPLLPSETTLQANNHCMTVESIACMDECMNGKTLTQPCCLHSTVALQSTKDPAPSTNAENFLTSNVSPDKFLLQNTRDSMAAPKPSKSEGALPELQSRWGRVSAFVLSRPQGAIGSQPDLCHSNPNHPPRMKPSTLLELVLATGKANTASYVPDGAESQQKLPPDISISRPVDADSVSGSEQSGSPEKRSSPHRNSHLSIPSAATGSQSGSHDERSFDDDDDNIDELFANHRSGSRLSAMRNNIGDSRESLASVYSNAGEINYGRIPVTGDIVFGLDYDHRHSVLKIDIRNCQNIAPVDTKHNRSDPYVKVYLLPDKTRSGKRKTKIKKHTLNPVFNEVLTYNISRGELENRTLWVTVWHSDRFGRNDFLGEVLIAMDTYRFDDPSPCAYCLQSRAQELVGEAMQYKGELSLSLMYVTPEKVAAASQKSKSKQKKSKSAVEPMGEIHVMIKSASNLTAVRSNGTSDPFVKGYLLPDRARNGKQKTPVVKNTVNPTWSHILVFDGITPEEISERSLELTLWDHEKLGTNEFLGGARLNTGLGVAKGLQVDWMDARGEEAMVWQAIMERHNVWIDARLPLRASMGKPSKK